MKKIVLLMVAAGAGFSAMAQVRGGDNFYASKWVIDLNVPVGVLMQSPTTKMDINYAEAVNARHSDIKMGTGKSNGADLGFGYFVGKKREFGIGAGIQYLSQAGDATMDNFHVEYRDNDSKGNVYRQLLTATHAIKEEMTITSINIPVVLKYKHRFNTRVGIAVDAGIVYNVSIQNKWKSDAEFNYEAIYQLAKDANGDVKSVYDNQPVYSDKDILYTVAAYTRTNSVGTIPEVFDALRAQGKPVELKVKPTNNSGTVNYTSGSIGFIFRPTVTYRLANRIHLNVGIMATYQSFQNKTDGSNYLLMDSYTSRKYTSMLNTVSASNNLTLGLNLGVRYFLGTPKDAQFDGKFDN